MKIIVKLSWPIYKNLGTRLLTLDFNRPEITITDVIEHIDRQYPGFKHDLDRGTGIADYLFFVNDTLVRRQDAATAQLHDGDKLFVILPIVGGTLL